ncbi:MAG: hypothetical protein CVV37_06455, partial [Nitrospira bacterium HGW-Nitrospira-1]
MEFGAGIASTDLELIKNNNDLKILINGQTDTLTIQNWLSGDAYRIEQFRFVDGTTLTPADIDAIGYKVYGTAGNDSLTGSNAKDIFDGGAGNDILSGGNGNDTYKFGIGSGQDTISDYNATADNTDTVEFGAGITQSDVEFCKVGNDLKIVVNGTTDSLTIQNWFSSSAYRVESFKFADGTALTISDIEAMKY